MVAPILAAVACYVRSRKGYAQGWRALALALTFWSGGLSINLLEVLGLPNPEPGPSISILLSVLYGVPILFTVASPVTDVLSVRFTDACLSLALGIVFFIHSFTFSSTADMNSVEVFHILLAFDVENLLIAMFALVRFIASREQEERRFFGSLLVYASLYTPAAWCLNHLFHDTDYGIPADLMIDVPFLALWVMATSGNNGVVHNFSLAVRQERLILAASPLMLPAMLLAVSAIIFPAKPAWAIAGFATATLVSGLRNVLTHMTNLEERDRLARLAQIDTLTNLPNRRYFEERYRDEWSRAVRAKMPLAVLMIDIDHFKMLNDGLGHAQGDNCLRNVAQALGNCAMRASDMIARYGGEEFVAVLPAANPAQAMQFAKMLKQAIYDLDLHSPGPKGRVTISIGIGHTETVDQTEPAILLKAADDALYVAKNAGRNMEHIKLL
ncbi:diguanylate cyclase [Novosphingobium barchaimii LL02]|uniref:diguanylate cyclase n=1 Tax=Novosphingobium barchaimii LL02 TaxID=1114963 RepID=A0A0J8AN84_9SPHN|nr:diguanylate cyclase [Novosphingobium barchaimii LL02]